MVNGFGDCPMDVTRHPCAVGIVEGTNDLPERVVFGERPPSAPRTVRLRVVLRLYVGVEVFFANAHPLPYTYGLEPPFANMAADGHLV